MSSEDIGQQRGHRIDIQQVITLNSGKGIRTHHPSPITLEITLALATVTVTHNMALGLLTAWITSTLKDGVLLAGIAATKLFALPFLAWENIKVDFTYAF